MKRNDVIMSLPKTMANMNLHKTKEIIYNLKAFDKSYPKMYFLLNLSNCVKIYRHLCQILACFTMTTDQMWSSHITQLANLKTCNLNIALDFRKSHKIYHVKVY